MRDEARGQRQVGIESFHHEPPADVSEDELAALIDAAERRRPRCTASCSSCPLPAHLDDAVMTALIDPCQGRGRPHAGERGAARCRTSSAPGAVHARRRDGAAARGRRGAGRRARPWWSGARTWWASRSPLLLLAANATVTHCHSRTRDLAEPCAGGGRDRGRGGRPGLITADMVREGAVVIDVGTNRTEDGLTGDVDFEGVRAKARAITPVPGGVGPDDARDAAGEHGGRGAGPGGRG